MTAFYWDRDDETRAWSKRFFERHGKMPTMAQAGTYSAIRHYLESIAAAGTDEAKAVMVKMREMPVNDFYTSNGRVREDGRMVHDMYFAQVKKPSKSTGPWDYYNILGVIPGNQAFRSLADSGCPWSRTDLGSIETSCRPSTQDARCRFLNDKIEKCADARHMPEVWVGQHIYWRIKSRQRAEHAQKVGSRPQGAWAEVPGPHPISRS